MKNSRFFAKSRMFAVVGLITTLVILFATLIISTYFQRAVNPKELIILKQLKSKDNSQTKIDWLNSEVNIIDPEDIEQFHQNDPRLLNYLRARHIWPPSRKLYDQAVYNGWTDKDVWRVIKPILEKLSPGFYVEAGAYDGLHSHTMKLELNYGWKGLLIECNPVLIPKILQLHRKAFFSDVCLSKSAQPKMTQLTSMDNWPASSSLGKGDIFPHHIKSNFTKFEVQTVPFYSVIAAVGVSVVDFIVLDIQSLEYEVLSHFPFQDILVKVWLIEVHLLSKDGQLNLMDLMKKNGYKPPLVLIYDYLFIHNSVK